LERLARCRLVFVDGLYAPELSNLPEFPSGVAIANLDAAAAHGSETVAAHLTRHASIHEHPFAALNTAFLQDGLHLYVPRGREIADPIHLVHVHTGAEAVASHPRHLIVLEEGASVTLLEDYVSIGDTSALTNPVMEIVLGPGARLRLHKMVREGANTYHVGGTFARL